MRRRCLASAWLLSGIAFGYVPRAAERAIFNIVGTRIHTSARESGPTMFKVATPGKRVLSRVACGGGAWFQPGILSGNAFRKSYHGDGGSRMVAERRTAACLAVGSELLGEQRLDSNSLTVTRTLAKYGPVSYTHLRAHET